jgi:poly-beta-1,6-N-acetyl-D-glucosamine biosynthesis protein PgaD
MEEPGQRPHNPEVFIKKEARSPLRRVAENFITIVCWGIYLYLILPLFTMVMWSLGVKTFYDQFIGARGYEDLRNLLKDGGITFFVVLLVLLIWTYYNYLWFKRRGERRGNRPLVNSDPWFAEQLCCSVENLETIRKSRRLVINTEETGYRITSQE